MVTPYRSATLIKDKPNKSLIVTIFLIDQENGCSFSKAAKYQGIASLICILDKFTSNSIDFFET